MALISGSVAILARLKTAKFIRSAAKLTGTMGGIKRKGKEMGQVFNRTGGILRGVFKILDLFTLGLFGTLTGLIALSPQFKAFLAGMKKPFLDLTMHLGRIFKPTMDKVLDMFKRFVSWVKTSPTANWLLNKLNDAAVWFLEQLDEMSKRVRVFFDTWKEEGLWAAIKKNWEMGKEDFVKIWEKLDLWGRLKKVWEKFEPKLTAFWKDTIMPKISSVLKTGIGVAIDEAISVGKQKIEDAIPDVDFGESARGALKTTAGILGLTPFTAPAGQAINLILTIEDRGSGNNKVTVKTGNATLNTT